MIVRECHCTREHDAVAWASLSCISCETSLVMRRCVCGLVLGVTRQNDNAACRIANLRKAARDIYERVRFEILLVRVEMANRAEPNFTRFHELRALARRVRRQAQESEAELAVRLDNVRAFPSPERRAVGS